MEDEMLKIDKGKLVRYTGRFFQVIGWLCVGFILLLLASIMICGLMIEAGIF
jgi:hypothetical protein